jgi:hypothetical protein
MDRYVDRRLARCGCRTMFDTWRHEYVVVTACDDHDDDGEAEAG